MSRPRDWMDWLVLVIAGVTILSGVIQIVAPQIALDFAGIVPADDTIYLFRLSSLLTALFGGMLLHSRLAGRQEPSVLLWVGLQKLLGAGAAALGVLNGTLAAAALAVAGYDLAAGVFLLWYLNFRKLKGVDNE